MGGENLLSLYDAYILANNTSRERVPGTYYVTELSGPCLRDAFYEFKLGWEHIIETLRIFECGNIVEDAWTKVLANSPGYRVLGTQLKAYHSFDIDGYPIEIHGRIDILAQHPDTRIVCHEVKTTSSTYYLGDQAKPEHIQQVTFYMEVTGLEHGQVDYLDKSNFLDGQGKIDLSFPQRKRPDLFRHTLNVCRSLHGFLKANILPPKSPCWKCGKSRKTGQHYCKYFELCGQDTHPDQVQGEEGQ
jgi:hypothetical protein